MEMAGQVGFTCWRNADGAATGTPGTRIGSHQKPNEKAKRSRWQAKGHELDQVEDVVHHQAQHRRPPHLEIALGELEEWPCSKKSEASADRTLRAVAAGALFCLCDCQFYSAFAQEAS